MGRRIGRSGHGSADAEPANWSLVDMASGLSRSHRALTIQLSLDPLVSSFDFVQSLRLYGREVPIGMFVAKCAARRTAFDLVDERPQLDLDQEGLLLMTLRLHGIELVECDGPSLQAEPRASNCRRIWRHRDRHIESAMMEALPRAFGDDHLLTIGELGEKLGLANAIPTVCALLCRRKLVVDLDAPLDDAARVCRRLPMRDPDCLPIPL